ncbi:hypothetical protein I8J29_13980 [Paenibacillus sp. MWE-103]|uniref:DUF2642 domain-containing protein n=1 Tax=Paenibacillus artemisiicola TaxID=1172618 RepID=A0ABS3WAY1_9BACL|nr:MULTISPECIES: hypothetical protein [Paenibacillus]MBO7745316.1 hypothetical protein [Paenibacillus artemisiicola]SFJ69078.1 hypothetical protein SAMN02799624_05514 [Paenibacillus sp. UNC496MF]
MLSLLKRYRGKFIVIKTTSGHEIGGRVLIVRNGIVVLKTPLGTKIFIPLRKVLAVIAK